MGFDTHMIAGNRACSTSGSATHPTITGQDKPALAETLPQQLVPAEGSLEKE
jgi:hypothetical protein